MATGISSMPLGHCGMPSLPGHQQLQQQSHARIQVKVAASGMHNFPHYRTRITHTGMVIPRPWSPAQGTPLTRPSPTHTRPSHPWPQLTESAPSQLQPVLQQLQHAIRAARAMAADRAWQQQQARQWRLWYAHHLAPALAAAWAWAQAAWLCAIAGWPVWLAAVQAVLAGACLAIEEAVQGRGPLAQLPAAARRLGKAWGLQRLGSDITQQTMQLAQWARSSGWHELQHLQNVQSLADALDNAARRQAPHQPAGDFSDSNSSSGSNTRGDEPMKQSAALALAAASITAKGVQPLSEFAFTFGRWRGKQQADGAASSSSSMRMPWEQQAAEPNTDEVWAEMMGLADGANWDSTWKEDTAPPQQQQTVQGHQVEHGGVEPATATRAAPSARQAFAAVGSASSRAVAHTQMLLAPAVQHGQVFFKAHRGPAIAVGLLVAASAVAVLARRWSQRHAAAVQDEVVRQVSLQLKAEELAAQRARFKRVLVASEPNRESRKTALLMQQQEEQDWESSAAAAASATASAAGSLAATAAAAAVKERASAMDDAALREWQRFVQQSRMGEVEQLWDPNMVEEEPQASAELLSRVTQQIRDAAKGDDDAEAAMQAAAAAQREAERMELEQLRLQQQMQQRRQQQQQDDAAGGLDAGAVQRARERRARAAAQALQQLQDAEQEREGSARAVAAANPFALSNEERAKWEADEHLYNDPKASQRGKQTAQQIRSSVASPAPPADSSDAPQHSADSSSAQRSGGRGSSRAADRSGRSRPSALEPMQGTRAVTDSSHGLPAPLTASPLEPAAVVPVAGSSLALTDEQRQEWGDWHEELGGIRGSAAARRRRQQQQQQASSENRRAASAAAAVPQPPELVHAQLEVPVLPAAVQQQRWQGQQRGVHARAWQQPLVQLLELLDEAGRLAARSISASISANLPSNRSNSGASRLRASAAQHAPQSSTTPAHSVGLPAEGASRTGQGVGADAQVQMLARQMREVAQELADEVVGASSLARGVAARDMDSVTAPAPVLPPTAPHHGATSTSEDAVVAVEAGVQETKIWAMVGEGEAEHSGGQERRAEAMQADVNPFAMPFTGLSDEDDEGEAREAEVARMQVVLPPVRAAFVQQRGA